MAVAGQFITVFKPRTYIAPKGTKLPSQYLDLDGAWPVGWIKIRNTANGVQVTPVNPHQDVASDENGVIATLPSGADTVNATWQSRTPEENLLKWIGGFAKREVSGVPEKRKLKFTAPVGTNGSVSIVLNGVLFSIAVTTAATTPAAVATAVAAGTFGTDWTAAVGTGVDNDSVIFTASGTNAISKRDGVYSYSPGSTGAAGTMTRIQAAAPAYDEFYLDPAEPNEFQVGLEGWAPAGTLRDEAVKVRVFMYNVQQTDNPQMHFRSTGSDGLLQPVATVRCLPGDIVPAMLEDTGIQKVDPKGRFSWMFI